MAHKTVSIVQEFPQPPSAVFAYLSNHDNLGSVFRRAGQAHQGRLRSERAERGRLGAAPRNGRDRHRGDGTAFEKDRLIEYRITKGGFMKHHLGTMRFSASGSGTRLDYTIEIESAIPLLTGPLAKALDSGIRKGLQKLSRSQFG